VDRAAHVDEVLLGPLAGMVRPRAGVGEGVERRVQGDQPDDFAAGRVVQFLERDLADDLVANVAPCPCGRGWRDEGYEKREGNKMPEQVQMIAQSAALLM
jgi:hypothetical protein